MNSKLDLVILLDDTAATNYIHEKFMNESQCVENCMAFQDGEGLLDYFKSEDAIIPELLFMDINMPVMDAWEFLEEFEKVKDPRLKEIVIILLSTSVRPLDFELATKNSLIKEVQTKPLSVEAIVKTINTYF